jgi:uncharacterized protein (DUF305 family)
MTKFHSLVAIAAIVAGLGSAVWAQQGMQGDGGMSMEKMMQDMMPTPSDAASTKDFKNAHMKMMNSMHIEYSGNPDVDFMRMMIPHHQGAIDMAKVEVEHGKDPELRKMAQKIIADQEKEIREMRAWLDKNKK